MRSQVAYLLLSTLALAANAAPFFPRQAIPASGSTFTNDTSPARLPQNDSNPKSRAAAIAIKQAGYIYGPSLIGEAAFFLNGTLGNARVQDDMDLWGASTLR